MKVISIKVDQNGYHFVFFFLTIREYAMEQEHYSYLRRRCEFHYNRSSKLLMTFYGNKKMFLSGFGRVELEYWKWWSYKIICTLQNRRFERFF